MCLKPSELRPMTEGQRVMMADSLPPSVPPSVGRWSLSLWHRRLGGLPSLRPSPSLPPSLPAYASPELVGSPALLQVPTASGSVIYLPVP